jgi:predicted nuclease of predicted toxin-antitoxin system
MARLLADENFKLPVVEALRALGHEVVTAQDEGLSGRADAEVLAAATAAVRAVVTHDRDFLRLHRTNRPHAGIVWCTVDQDAGALAVRIDRALTATPALADQLVRVYRPATP